MTAKRVVVLTNPSGLHARAAARFVKKAFDFTSDVHVLTEDGEANGKSILQMLTVGAAEGSRVTIVAHGDDAQEAASALAAVLVDVG